MGNVSPKTAFHKLIAIYARVSTARQEEEQTIQTQLGTLREFAEKNHYRIVEEYVDDGWSGDVLVRPSLDKLRQDAAERAWEAVLIYDPDRLARRYSYQELVSDELREKGIEVIYVTVSAPKNSEEKILHGVRGLFAEYERAKIAERFRLGKLRKIKDGNILLSEAPYGYTYITKREGKPGYLEINESEAAVVRQMFRWIADEGITLRAMIRRLHDSGIKPRKCKRGVWSTSTLSKVLRTEAYIGRARWGASYAVVPEKPVKKDRYRKTRKSSRKMRPKEEWLTVAVPPIVDEDLFKRARKQLETNFALCQRNRKNEYLLAGKIRCVCGRSRSGEGVANGKHRYYRCTDRVACFPLPPSCSERGVRAGMADDLVWHKLSELMSSPELLLQQATRWLSDQQAKSETCSADTEVMERDVAKLEEQEDRFNRAYGAGVLSVEQLREYVEPLRSQIIALRAQMERSRQQGEVRKEKILPNLNEVAEFSQRAKVGLRKLKFSEKRAIVLNTVDTVVATNEHLKVYGYIPLENHVELFPNHRHGWNTNRHENHGNIPFKFAIDLPRPPRGRIIVSRSPEGRILNSVVIKGPVGGSMASQGI